MSLLDVHSDATAGIAFAAFSPSRIVTVAVKPDTSGTPGGTLSIAIRTGTRCARRTRCKPDRRWATSALRRSPAFARAGLAKPRSASSRSLQDNMSCAGGTLLGFGQWEGEKEGRPFGGARCMNAPTQTADQLADDR
jgi:hypothetical protein